MSAVVSRPRLELKAAADEEIVKPRNKRQFQVTYLRWTVDDGNLHTDYLL